DPGETGAASPYLPSAAHRPDYPCATPGPCSYHGHGTLREDTAREVGAVMRLVTFETNGVQRSGAVVGERVIDLAAAAVALGTGSLPAEMLELLRLGDAGLETARATLAAAGDGERGAGQYTYNLSQIRLRAPICVPGKIVCVGQNYRDHVLEQYAQMPEKPILFAKFSTCIIGPDDDIIHPTTTGQLDYEVELAVVI